MSAWDGWYVKPASLVDRLCLGRDAKWVIGNRWGQVRWHGRTREEAHRDLDRFRIEEQARIEIATMVREDPQLRARLHDRLRAKGFSPPEEPAATAPESVPCRTKTAIER